MEDLDKEFWEEGIHMTMLLDNFSRHKWREITNIQFIFLSPNLTPHVQPADARIIWNLKAKYGRSRPLCLLDKEEAGEEDILYLWLTCSRWCTCLLKPGMPSIQRLLKHIGAIQESYHPPDLLQALSQSWKSKLRLQMWQVLQNLNTVIKSCSGWYENMHNPTLVDNIKILLAEPTPPAWPVEDDDARDLIAAAKGPTDEMPVKESPPAMWQEVLAAMQLLSCIAIECRNEQEFLQRSPWSNVHHSHHWLL